MYFYFLWKIKHFLLQLQKFSLDSKQKEKSEEKKAENYSMHHKSAMRTRHLHQCLTSLERKKVQLS